MAFVNRPMLCSLLLVLSLATAARAAVPPTGFDDELVVLVSRPTALAFTPDGRMLIAQQTGELRVFDGTQLVEAPALDLTARICSNGERGLLGLAVDPQFATNRYIYLGYVAMTNGTCDLPVSRVSRFTLPDTNVVDPATELVLVDNVVSPTVHHVVGDIAFGPDGYLYATFGDGACDYANDSGCGTENDAARDMNALYGKVVRIESDGGAPDSNPFIGPDSAPCAVTGTTDPGKICAEIYAFGFRNPWRIAFDPNAGGTRFFINDVGQEHREEISEAAPGADFGWNCIEGTKTGSEVGKCLPAPENAVAPLFEYAHGASVPGTSSPTNCNSISGGAFIPDGHWPGYDGTYFFADFICGTIFTLSPTHQASIFASAARLTVDLSFGPFEDTVALYYTNILGQVRRISRRTAPTAMLEVTGQYGTFPRTALFDATESFDPDGAALTYLWDFGDGTEEETSTPEVSHEYVTSGVYRVTLQVRDAAGEVSPLQSLDIRPEAMAKGDFNADGVADLVIQNTAGGENAIWYANGLTITHTAAFQAAGLPEWKIVGTADFDHDGDSDLLWQHDTTGSMYLWYMDGATLVEGVNFKHPGSVGWKVAAIADFNRDGWSDIFWTHADTAQNYLWLLEGTEHVGGGNVNKPIDNEWRVAGADDFNADGAPDFLWRHRVTGQNYLWFLNGTVAVGQSNVASFSDLAWRIAAVGDFTGEGRPDVVWQHTDGSIQLWKMEGAVNEILGTMAGPGFDPNLRASAPR